MSMTKTTTASGIVLPDDLATRYRLAESQLALLPPADEDDAEEWLALRTQCEEVMAFIERIAAAEAQVAELQAQIDALRSENATMRKALVAVQECFNRCGSWPPSITGKIREALAARSAEPRAEQQKEQE